MIVEFDDNLITGNEMIDTQHRELISRISQLLSSCENGDGTQKAIEMLDYLMDYTVFHFGEEEKLQEEIEYPGIKEHKEKHEEFKQTIRSLKNTLTEGGEPTAEFVAKVQENVADWLIRHIQGFDRSVAEYKFMTSNPNLL